MSRSLSGIFTCTKLFTLPTYLPLTCPVYGVQQFIRANPQVNVECRENRLKSKLKVASKVSPHLVIEFARIPLRNVEIRESSSQPVDIFQDRVTTTQPLISRGWQRLCLQRPRELSHQSNAYVRSFVRWMQPWLLFPASSSFEYLTVSSLNKFSRSVEQAPGCVTNYSLRYIFMKDMSSHLS